VTGPVSFGFRVVDENLRPIIYNDDVRGLLFDFIARKYNGQYAALKRINANAFVWLDEPGLGWVFSGLSGYSDTATRQDYRDFWAEREGPRALHLCAGVNLPYLLDMELDLLSFDAYQIELMPKGYAAAVADFIRGGGVISWGIIPTDAASQSRETPATLSRRLQDYWQVVADDTGLDIKQIAEQALLAPARCCLKNAGLVGAADDVAAEDIECNLPVSEEELVTTAFDYLEEVSGILRERFGL
jgi:hypothetical protein